MKTRYSIGVDVGGTNVRIALFDAHFRIRSKVVLRTRRFFRKETLIKVILSSIDDMLRGCGVAKRQVAGVGLGFPGPIDTKRGIVHFLPNIPGWKEVRLSSLLRKAVKMPVYIDNDANLMALAEYRRGAARGTRNAVCLTLGTGVGGGVIIEGKLYHGSSDAAGEIGHMPFNSTGPRCSCGGSACLEQYIGNTKILKKARALFRRAVSLEELSAKAYKGDKRARDLWSEVGTHLGITLAGVINLLNPDCVVIGGGVANAGNVLLHQVRKVVGERAMRTQARQVRIVKAALGEDAGLIGAALLAQEGLKA